MDTPFITPTRRPWLAGFAVAWVALAGLSACEHMSQREQAPVPPPVSATEPVVVAAATPAVAPPPVAQSAAPETATLTVVDSRRVPSVNDQSLPVDLNIIPSNQMAHMDVVTGGAADHELTEVQTTGTRIQQPYATSTNPITTITKEEMNRLGIVNVGGMLAAGGAVDPSFGGRTLTLADGRRVVSVNDQTLPGYYNIDPSQPARTGNERFGQFVVNPVKRTTDEPVSTFSIDVDTSSYSFVRRQLNAGALPQAAAVRTEEMINYFDYAWPTAATREQPFQPTVTVTDSPWHEGHKLVHIGIKGYELPATQRPDVNLVLLLDVSGSMNSPDKLPLAQRSLAMLLDNLQPNDTVGIAVYAGAAGEVLAPTPVKEKDTILRALYALQPGGSTAGVAGIRVAYDMAARSFRKGGVNRILLATDGDFNVGINDPNELKRFVEQQRDRGIMLSVLGFGVGNYRDDIAQVLAQNGNGVAAYIDSVNEAHKVLVQQANAQLFTIAKDVKIQVEFNPATVAEYRLVGYETRALAREDFNNDRIDAGDVGAGHAVTAIYEITPVGVRGIVDASRYGAEEKPVPAVARGKVGEYGFVKIRYKLPDSNTSRLIEQPIAVTADASPALRADVRFATAVAGFAQLLQGGDYAGSLTYDEVFHEAEDALGKDPQGNRAEFLQLVRRAQYTVRR